MPQLTFVVTEDKVHDFEIHLPERLRLGDKTTVRHDFLGLILLVNPPNGNTVIRISAGVGSSYNRAILVLLGPKVCAKIGGHMNALDRQKIIVEISQGQLSHIKRVIAYERTVLRADLVDKE